ncbi:MAG: ABC transporter permease, partial [Clostridia bacterium]|nr:ABC transporter permease [Clostridia bacterium]
NITFRIKGNYRSLAMLAVMTATTITAFGTSLSLRYYVDATHHIEFPYSFSYVLNDQKVDDKVIETINASKHKLLLNEKLNYIRVPMKIDEGMGHGTSKFETIRYSDFVRISKELEKQYPGKVHTYPKIAGNQTFVVFSPATIGGLISYKGKTGTVGETQYHVLDEFSSPLFGSGILYQGDCLVVSDEAFETLSKGQKPQVFHGIIVSDPKNSLELAKSLQSVMPKDTKLFMYVTKYLGTYTYMGLFYFLGSFMSIVFILATGSIMYFKILSEALADKSKYDILKKVGMSRKEIKKAVSMQVGLSLILPLGVGILHSLFAIDALRRMLNISLVLPTAVAISIFALFYAVFYVATTKKFMKLVY